MGRMMVVLLALVVLARSSVAFSPGHARLFGAKAPAPLLQPGRRSTPVVYGSPMKDVREGIDDAASEISDAADDAHGLVDEAECKMQQAKNKVDVEEAKAKNAVGDLGSKARAGWGHAKGFTGDFFGEARDKAVALGYKIRNWAAAVKDGIVASWCWFKSRLRDAWRSIKLKLRTK